MTVSPTYRISVVFNLNMSEETEDIRMVKALPKFDPFFEALKNRLVA
jgi:hypothetical protein